MKKSLFTLASLALAIALAFAFVACEQPVEEDASAGSAAILRLYIDRPDGLTLDFNANDELEIRAGQEIFVDPAVECYPYPIIQKPRTDGIKIPVNKSVDGTGITGSIENKFWKGWEGVAFAGTNETDKNSSVSYDGKKIDDLAALVSSVAKDRLKVIAIPPFRQASDGAIVDEKTVTVGSSTAFFGYPDFAVNPIAPISGNPNISKVAGSVIQTTNPKMKYLYSGLVALKDSASGGTTAGHVVAFDSKKNAYYIDVELLDKTPGSKGYDDFFKSSGSFYVELRVGATGGTFASDAAGGMPAYYYMYTPGKKGFNDIQGMINGTAVYKTDNANIKKLNLKPGINEISLSDFSFAGQHVVDSKIW